MSKSNEEALSMFFEEEFNSSNYLDALFNSLIGDYSSGNTYKKENLQRMAHNCNKLITHLDYYTSELTVDLNKRLEKLQGSTSMVASTNISPADYEGDVELGLSSTVSKLSFLIDSLKNSIVLLKTDFEETNEKIKTATDVSPQVVAKLNNLHQIKINLEETIRTFEKLNTLDDHPEMLTASSLDSSLSYLLQTIENQMKTANEKDKIILIDKVNDLIRLLPVFKGYSDHYQVFKKFVVRLESLKD